MGDIVTGWMGRRPVLLFGSILALQLAGCSGFGGVRPDLSGAWRGRFWFDGAMTRIASGEVRLRPSPEHGSYCAEDPVACETAVRGTDDISFAAIGHRLENDSAQAAVLSDDEILLLLGPCCDRGEISALGRMDGGKIRGSWEETRIGGGRTGRFELERQR